jgi:hypothetical protein
MHHPPAPLLFVLLSVLLLLARAVIRRIAAAIHEAGLQGQAHPLDYLQFFCLAKRESNDQYNGGVSHGLLQ